MPGVSDISFAPAVVTTRRLRDRELSAAEVMAETLDRIDKVNPSINAIVAQRPRGELMAEAEAADAGPVKGPLHGLPMAIKDLADVAGMPTRRGSLITSDKPVATDTLFVSRLREAGAIFIGKTNSPEFGAGSNTFNEVFGITRNPHNRDLTPGGSSGGAAAALASGMLALADGSDLGGSLRNPAAFCGVVGLRPSIGRIPAVPARSGFLNTLAVSGPMARSVEDLGLLLSIMAGPDPRDPTSLSDDPTQYAASLRGDLEGVRVAWAGELGLTWEPDCYSVARATMDRFDAAGSHVEDAAPDLSGAMDVFRTLRSLIFSDFGEVVPEEKWPLLKETVRWNIQCGRDLVLADVTKAELERTRIHLAMTEFFERYDVLALPTTQVAPFPVEIEYPTEIGGTVMEDYIDWMSSCCVISSTGCPAISVPAGFTSDGLPVGLQLVAAVGQEAKLLDIAKGFENASADLRRDPVILA